MVDQVLRASRYSSYNWRSTPDYGLARAAGRTTRECADTRESDMVDSALVEAKGTMKSCPLANVPILAPRSKTPKIRISRRRFPRRNPPTHTNLHPPQICGHLTAMLA